jgi:hypothetical protein
MAKLIQVEQGSDEWHSLRLGKVTASIVHIVMANYNSPFGESAKNLARKIAIERVTNMPCAMGFDTAQLARGREQEHDARVMYESIRFVDVKEGGFFLHPNNKWGYSPDGLVGDNGLLEIKSLEGHVFLKTLESNNIPNNYRWQLVMALFVSGRKFIDFVNYSAYMPVKKQMHVQRLTEQDFKIELYHLENRLLQFENLIAEKMNILKN